MARGKYAAGSSGKYNRENVPEEYAIKPSDRGKARAFAESIAEQVTDPEDKARLIEVLTPPEKVCEPVKKSKTYAEVWTPQTSSEMAYTQMVLYDLLTEYRKPKVRNDQELAERIDQYFTRCAEKGKTPLVEELCLACGLSPSRFSHIISGAEKGFSPITKEIFQKARDFMQAFDAKMVMANKVPFLAYCFRAKVYYGMHEDASRENLLDGRDPDSVDRLTPKQLQEKYMQGIEAVEYEDKTNTTHND